MSEETSYNETVREGVQLYSFTQDPSLIDCLAW